MTYHFDTQAFVRRMEAAGMARKIAEELADVLGSGVLDGLATKRDVDGSASRLEMKIKELELRITVRMGAMTAATIAILGALVAFK